MPDYAFEGPKWSASTITWSFATAGAGFSNAITGAYQSTVRAAVARWAQVTNVVLKEVPDSANVNIRIGWSTFSNTQVGETDYAYVNGPNHSQTFGNGTVIRLEDPSAWALGTGRGDYYQGTSTTLYQTVLHEFGHALGLAHSSNPSAVMYASLGPSDTDLSSADIGGVQVLYGTPAAGAVSAIPVSAAISPVTVSQNSAMVPVYRFFDTSSGTQFLTASASEQATVLATRPDLTYEGLGLGGLAPGADAGAVPVYRFFDTTSGTHFFTASQSEQSNLLTSRPDLVPEQTTFYEHATAQTGDVAVYRFFDKNDGTHFYTASADERNAIVATRSDMALEGIAFYAPATS